MIRTTPAVTLAYAKAAARRIIKRERDEMSMPHTCRCSICHREMQDFTAINTITSQATRIRDLAAELAEAKLQRDSWKRIAESGLGITAETLVEAAARSGARTANDTGGEHG